MRVEHSQGFGNERAYRIQLLVRRGEHDQGEAQSGHVLLMLDVAVEGQEDLEASVHSQAEQYTVLDGCWTSPSQPQ